MRNICRSLKSCAPIISWFIIECESAALFIVSGQKAIVTHLIACRKSGIFQAKYWIERQSLRIKWAVNGLLGKHLYSWFADEEQMGVLTHILPVVNLEATPSLGPLFSSALTLGRGIHEIRLLPQGPLGQQSSKLCWWWVLQISSVQKLVLAAKCPCVWPPSLVSYS